MTKIFFPYNDQPKQFSFKFPEPIRFPFYVNDLVYFWEVDAHGITLYLHNHVAPTLKHIELEESGITMYLYNEELNVGKYIFVEFAKVGLGLYTLGDLDPLTLGYIDGFTLGEISNYAADWMMMLQSSVKAASSISVDADSVEMRIKSDSVLSYTKTIHMDNLREELGIIGVNNIRSATIGELDPHTLDDIDAMLSAFRMFEKIPASLVKEIRISHTNILQNNVVSPQSEFGVSASNIDIAIIANSTICNVGYTLQFNEQFIGVENGSVPLVVSVDEVPEEDDIPEETE